MNQHGTFMAQFGSTIADYQLTDGRSLGYGKQRIFLRVCQECAATQKRKAPHRCEAWYYWWAHLDSNQGPKDYESSALTN